MTQLEIKTDLLNIPVILLAVAIPDINHKVLAEVFAKILIPIFQKKAFGELYHVFHASYTFNVCGSYNYYDFFPYKLAMNKNAKVLHLYCTDL